MLLCACICCIREETCLTKARDSRVHETFVDGKELLRAESELLHDARPKRLNDDVGALDEPFEDLYALRLLEVQRQRSLAATQRIGALATDAINAQHARTVITQYHAAVRYRCQSSYFNHSDPLQTHSFDAQVRLFRASVECEIG